MSIVTFEIIRGPSSFDINNFFGSEVKKGLLPFRFVGRGLSVVHPKGFDQEGFWVIPVQLRWNITHAEVPFDRPLHLLPGAMAFRASIHCVTSGILDWDDKNLVGWYRPDNDGGEKSRGEATLVNKC